MKKPLTKKVADWKSRYRVKLPGRSRCVPIGVIGWSICNQRGQFDHWHCDSFKEARKRAAEKNKAKFVDRDFWTFPDKKPQWMPVPIKLILRDIRAQDLPLPAHIIEWILLFEKELAKYCRRKGNQDYIKIRKRWRSSWLRSLRKLLK